MTGAPAPQVAAAEYASRRLARLAAVQGLYQIALSASSPAEVVRDFRDHPPPLPSGDNNETAVSPGSFDQELFGEIVTGVMQNTAALDEMIAGAFDAKLSAGRVEALLRAVLRAGAYELHYHAKIPTGVIINDYVDVAHAFFGQKEPGLVNAVLDKLAKKLRQG